MSIVPHHLRTFIAESATIGQNSVIIESEDEQNSTTNTMSTQKTEVVVDTAEVGQNSLIIDTVNEQNNTTLEEAYEKWLTEAEKWRTIEAETQQARAKEYEKRVKEYERAAQKARAKYTKWQESEVIVVSSDDESEVIVVSSDDESEDSSDNEDYR